MTTTIQISNTTKQILEKLKEKEHVTSYEQVIQNLLKKYVNLPESMFGVDKGISWSKKDRMQIREL